MRHNGEKVRWQWAVSVSVTALGAQKISARRLVVRARDSRWVCSRAEQRASPPVLYSASGGYRRTAKAPIACDFSCGLERKAGLPWSECSGADEREVVSRHLVCYGFFTEESPRLGM